MLGVTGLGSWLVCYLRKASYESIKLHRTLGRKPLLCKPVATQGRSLCGSSSCSIPFIPPAPLSLSAIWSTGISANFYSPSHYPCSISQPATTTLPSMVFTSTTAPLTVTMTATTRRTWWKVGDIEGLIPAAGSSWKEPPSRRSPVHERQLLLLFKPTLPSTAAELGQLGVPQGS